MLSQKRDVCLSRLVSELRLGNETAKWCSIKGRMCPWYNSVEQNRWLRLRSFLRSSVLFWCRKSPAFFLPAIDDRFTARLLAAPRDLSIALTRSWNVRTFGKLPMRWRWMMDSWKSGNWIHRLRQLIYPFNPRLFSESISYVNYRVYLNDRRRVNS